MPDETPTPSAPADTGGAPAPESTSGAAAPAPDFAGADAAAADKHATRIRDKVGAPEPGGTAATGTEAAPGAEPQKRRSAAEIGGGFAARIQEKQSRREMAAELERLRGTNNELTRFFKELIDEGEAAGKVDDPEPEYDPANPKPWHAWQQRELKRQLEAATAPLRQYVEGQTKRESETTEQAQKREQFEARRAERAGTMREAEAEYLATPEGKGYPERLGAFAEKLQAFFRQFSPNDREAAGHVAAYLDGMVTHALQVGVNPAVYVDLYAQNWGINGTPAPAGPGAAPEKTDEEIASLRKTAASGLATSLSAGGAAGASDTTAALRQGVTKDRLRAKINADAKGSVRANLKKALWDAGAR